MWFMALAAAWLLCISIADIRKRNVPVWMLIPGGFLAMAMFLYRQGNFWDMVKGVLPGIFLLLTAFATKKAGYGDGIAMLFLGILSGGGVGMVILLFSLILAAAVSLVLLVLKKAGKNTKIPFLPFLSIAWLVVAAV